MFKLQSIVRLAWMALSALTVCTSASAGQSAFSAIQVEKFDSQKGVDVINGMAIGNFENSDYVGFSSIDFGTGASSFSLSLAVPRRFAGQRIEFHLDSAKGPIIGSLVTRSTGSFQKFTIQKARLTSKPTGVRNLYLVAKGKRGKVGNIDWLIFTRSQKDTQPAPQPPVVQQPAPQPMTPAQPPMQMTGFDAFQIIEAELFSSMSGIQMEKPNYVGYFDNGDFVRYNQVNFGTGAATFSASLAAISPLSEGQKIELRIDSEQGQVIATMQVNPTGDWEQFQIQSAVLDKTVSGTHDLYLIARGGFGIANIDSFLFGRSATQIGNEATPEMPMQMPPITPTPVPMQMPMPSPQPTPMTMPVADLEKGRTLYTQYCSGCHQPLETTTRLGVTAAQINMAFSMVGSMKGLASQLTQNDLQSIELALKPENARVDSCTSSNLSKTTMRRLNFREYSNAVKDLLGQSNLVATDFLSDNYGVSSFDTDASSIRMDRADAEKVILAAEKAVEFAMSNPSSPLNGCNNSSSKQSCIQNLLQPLMKKAYRRPVTAAEVQNLVLLATQQFAAKDGVRDGVVAILSSPHFLFHVVDYSKNRQGTLHTLSSYELASRLSFFLWSSLPDDELMAVADNGNLLNAGTLKAQVSRMLKSPKAKEFINNFSKQWLGLYKVENASRTAAAHPEFNANLKKSMVTEAQMLFEDTLNRNLDISALLTAKYAFVDKALAALYGLQYPTNATGGFTPVELDGDIRRGVLTSAGFMTATSNNDFTNPIIRGSRILRNVICSPPGNPPKVFNLDKVDPTLPMRERLAAHRSDASCANCHSAIDPVGLAFENFNSIGKWRSMDHGETIDPGGTTKEGFSFKTTGQLMNYMGTGEKFKFCMVQKVGAYGVGRDLSLGDQCEIKKVLNDYMNAPNLTLTDIIQGIVTSEFFKNSNVKD